MKHLTPQHKHSILLQYQPHSRDHSFAALAARHGVAGGWQVIQKWHDRWNGTAVSLEEQPHSGRPRTLSRAEVQQYIAPPILAKNCSAQRVHYPDIHAVVEEKSGKHMSLRTLQRYGKQDLNAHQTRGKKRAADESEYTETYNIDALFVSGSM